MVIATTDGPIFANVPSKPNELLKFRREICVNRLFALLAGLMGLRSGGPKGSNSVSTGHPPLKPLPDPIPLKIQFPINLSARGYLGAAKALMVHLGVPVGPARLPNRNPDRESIRTMLTELEAIGFFGWKDARSARAATLS